MRIATTIFFTLTVLYNSISAADDFRVIPTTEASLNMDNFRVLPITESSRNMDKSIFKAPQAVIDQYIPDGAPASMSSYILRTETQDVLFDAGMNSGGAWAKQAEKAGVKTEAVKHILLTHLHPDHIGGLLDGSQRRFPNAKISCSRLEYEYWNQEPRNTQLAAIKKAYGDHFSGNFEFDTTVFREGDLTVTAMNAVGHTPGHTVFLLKTPQQQLLIIGDLLHGAALQFPRPEICSNYDMDTEKTVESRKRILDFAAEKHVRIAGMHLPPPGIGTVKKIEGGYEWNLFFKKL